MADSRIDSAIVQLAANCQSELLCIAANAMIKHLNWQFDSQRYMLLSDAKKKALLDVGTKLKDVLDGYAQLAEAANNPLLASNDEKEKKQALERFKKLYQDYLEKINKLATSASKLPGHGSFPKKAIGIAICVVGAAVMAGAILLGLATLGVLQLPSIAGCLLGYGLLAYGITLVDGCLFAGLGGVLLFTSQHKGVAAAVAKTANVAKQVAQRP